MPVTTEWTLTSHRTETESRVAIATRNMVTFAVLDYDSFMRLVNGEQKRVVAVLYKKITTSHSQRKDFTCAYESDDSSLAFKGFAVPTTPISGVTPATDDYTYSGLRTVEYKLAIVDGTEKTLYSFNTLTISISGSYNKSGSYSALTTDGGLTIISGPTHTVTGNRIYGASVYVGKKYVIYSYDLETFTSPSGYGDQYDSPFNFEDYNPLWTKSKRVVGFVKLDTMQQVTREYDYDAEMESLVYATGYYSQK